MRRSMCLAFVLSLVVLGGMPATLWAQPGYGIFGGRFSAFLAVDASPLQAQVALDGRPLGSARELMAQALPMAPGEHTIEISAPGFRRYVQQFSADTSGSVSQFKVDLPPE